MTSLCQCLVWINYNHGTTEYRSVFLWYLPWCRVCGTAQR